MERCSSGSTRHETAAAERRVAAATERTGPERERKVGTSTSGARKQRGCRRPGPWGASSGLCNSKVQIEMSVTGRPASAHGERAHRPETGLRAAGSKSAPFPRGCSAGKRQRLLVVSCPSCAKVSPGSRGEAQPEVPKPWHQTSHVRWTKIGRSGRRSTRKRPKKKKNLAFKKVISPTTPGDRARATTRRRHDPAVTSDNSRCTPRTRTACPPAPTLTQQVA